MTYKINFILNDEPIETYVKANTSLLDMLREEFDLTGAKVGCGVGECGACTVILNNHAVNSCLILAVEVDQCDIVTIEGLAKSGQLDPLQTAFIDTGAIQCGFCTPGMIMSAKALLTSNSEPSVEAIKESISGNLCRCTGYKKIVEAIQTVADKRKS